MQKNLYQRVLIALTLSLWGTCLWAYGTFAPLTKDYNLNPNQTLLTAKDEKEKQAIVNSYSGNPGCYIMCLGPEGGLYAVTNQYWLHGMIRIKGHYLSDSATTEMSKRNCYPDDLEGSFSPFTYYRDLCNSTFPSCQKHCTGSADTGSWRVLP